MKNKRRKNKNRSEIVITVCSALGSILIFFCVGLVIKFIISGQILSAILAIWATKFIYEGLKAFNIVGTK